MQLRGGYAAELTVFLALLDGRYLAGEWNLRAMGLTCLGAIVLSELCVMFKYDGDYVRSESIFIGVAAAIGIAAVGLVCFLLDSIASTSVHS